MKKNCLKMQTRKTFRWLLLSGIVFTMSFPGNFQKAQAQDMGATALVAPTTPMCPATNQTVTVTIQNYALAAIDFAVNNCPVTVNITGASTQSFTNTLITGILAAGATQNVDVTIVADLSAPGIHIFNANTTVAGDVTPANDAMTAVSITVNPNPTVSISASANPICAGTSTTLTASGATTYSWSGGLGTANPVTVTPASTTTYTVTGTTAGCTATATSTVTVNPNLSVSVSIVANPAGAICAGTSVTFTATPTNGGSTPTYQWKKNGLNISGATNSTYTSATLANADVITCVVTSSLTCATGSPATSNSITITVSSLPASVSIAANQTGAIFCTGTSVTFTATPTNGGTTPTYQWQKNGLNIGGATNVTYTSSTLADGDIITCVMTSSLTCVTGSPATSNSITMSAIILSFTYTPPSSATSCDGSLTAIVSGGTPPYAYQWDDPNQQVTQTATGLCAGVYTIIVTDSNLCTATDTINFTFNTYISGYVYHDINGNCVFDSTDSPLENIIVKRIQGLFAYTDFNGYYKLPADTGTNIVKIFITDLVMKQSCPVNNGSYIINFATIGDSSVNNNFGINYLNLISGYIYSDEDSDCVFEPIDLPLNNVIVKLEPGPIYCNSDINGYYKFPVNTGTYTFYPIITSPLAYQSCPDTITSYTVTFTNLEDSSMNNNYGISYEYCAILTVNISSGNLRPCFSNNLHYIYYNNQGIIPVYNAMITVEFDSVIVPNYSSLPWSSQNGNIYTFMIDSILPGGWGSFLIQSTITCDMNLVGTTKCVTAHIYPDTLCAPENPVWDKSSVEVEGECVNDSLACFTIYNTGDPGTGDMQGTSEYRIFENDTLVYTGQFQLAGGDSLVICWVANGKAIRLEADQRPGHPGNSHPKETVEDCGDDFGTSLGFVNTVPQDDYDPFIDIDCKTLTFSYDPNEKKVVPEGVTGGHYIDSTAVLEYQIYFQNTGTDTAFNIIIRDTLSEYLDITTVTTGAGSHPYTFNIFGSGILEWTFENILLPDSNINEPESHGFVCFSVHQKPNNEIGTVIPNRAGIIFDYNEPVITDSVYNIVWELPLIIVHTPDIIDSDAEIVVYPNPSNTSITFELHNYFCKEPYNFELYDNLGKEVKSVSDIQVNKFQISAEILSKGIYHYQIYNKKSVLGKGKLIVY